MNVIYFYLGREYLCKNYYAVLISKPIILNKVFDIIESLKNFEMKILSGQNLVDEVRKLCNVVTQRLWIAVPYLGTYETVQEILGSVWLTNHKISFKLLIDRQELNSISAPCVMALKKRGQVKSLRGLHAKIFVIDDKCIVGSANLTRTSFTKRYEAAILLPQQKADHVITLFQTFWEKGKRISDDELNIIGRNKKPSEDEGNYTGLDTLTKLHKTQLVKEDKLGKKYLSYGSIVEQFKDFSRKYEAVVGKRLWPKTPLYYEVDSFLNYLFDPAPGQPSHRFKYLKSRKLKAGQQSVLLKKYVYLFRKYVQENDKKIHYKKDTTSLFKKKLSKNQYNKLKWDDIDTILRRTNAGYSQPINISKATNSKNNNLKSVRTLLYNLVNGDEQLEWRMYQCDTKVFGISSSMMNEILHFHSPNTYPLINLRSCAGLRFFGYHLNEHRANKKNDY
jgi:hypothetical protein